MVSDTEDTGFGKRKKKSKHDFMFLCSGKSIIILLTGLILIGLIFSPIFLSFQEVLADTAQTSVTVTTVAPPRPPSAPPPPLETKVIFEGRAYPLSKVNILKDGQMAISTIAGPDANFYVSLSGLSSGNYIFTVYGEDSQGRRSALFTFSVFITQGVTTKISGIFISPTIAVDKSEVKRGDNIAIFGQSAPQSEITIQVSSEEEFFAKTI
ncbi:MAG: hypothetical protein Q8M94_19985, partial [Ignavibacteria bacterium]|nr:hypothetical protein [Ignavibacteria bacterium]